MDKYATLSLADLIALQEEKQAEFAALRALPAPTAGDFSKASDVAAEIKDIKAARKTMEAGFDAIAESFADEPEPTPEDNTVKGGKGNAEGEVKTEESPGDNIPAGHVPDGEGAPVPVQAADEGEGEGGTEATGSGVEALALKTKRPTGSTAVRDSGPVKIVAAPDVQGFANGQDLSDLLGVANAAISRAKGFPMPQGDGKSIDLRKFPTASFALDFPEELIVDARSGETAILEAMDRAADERRLPNGSLTAAGGWCAPSETVYDLSQDATTEGMLSLPEIGVRRGGIRFAQSPTFADFYANPGFVQTETQAIAGTTKTCVEVDCPDFTEVRLDVEGVCIKVPILTNVGYPEYVRNFVDGTLIAHQHWINANVIGRLVTAAGAARVIAGLGSTVTDSLNGLTLLAEQTRQKYRLSMNASLEVVVPFWVRSTFQADLANRTGVPFESVTEAQVKAFFAARRLNVQFVYDWQVLDETAEVYPATYNALMYPAGTFVKGTADVISLSTIYDAASLATNVFTGLFTEQGFLVALRKFHADLVTLPICNAGRTGAANLTCA